MHRKGERWTGNDKSDTRHANGNEDLNEKHVSGNDYLKDKRVNAIDSLKKKHVKEDDDSKKQLPPQQGNNRGRLTTFLMVLLACQYGLQPVALQKCMGPDVITTTAVLACEFLKVASAAVLMTWNGMWASTWRRWRLRDALAYSALPAATYSMQNMLLHLAYRHLDYISFSLFNQSKLLFTALFMFLVLRQKQSVPQIGALVMMVVAAVLLTVGQTRSPSSSESKSKSTPGSDMDVLWWGIVPVVTASALSGLSSSLCQLATQRKGKSAFLMTIEMSTIGCLLLLASLARSPDGETIRSRGFFHGWTPLTIVPVLVNSVGGILVGLVTQYAGGVKKNFALVSALIVTACAQFIVDGAVPSMLVWIALPLVAGSTLIHSSFPVKEKVKSA